VSVLVRIVCALGLAGILATAFTLPRILLSDNIPAIGVPSAGVVSGFASDLDFKGNATDRHGHRMSGDQRGDLCVVGIGVYSLTYYRLHAHSRAKRLDAIGAAGTPIRCGASAGRRRPAFAVSVRDVCVSMKTLFPK
jgi:hypothetical protein